MARNKSKIERRIHRACSKVQSLSWISQIIPTYVELMRQDSFSISEICEFLKRFESKAHVVQELNQEPERANTMFPIWYYFFRLHLRFGPAYDLDIAMRGLPKLIKIARLVREDLELPE